MKGCEFPSRCSQGDVSIMVSGSGEVLSIFLYMLFVAEQHGRVSYCVPVVERTSHETKAFRVYKIVGTVIDA